jgi:peptidyl-prolyl cis-trans isomerase B (cyclophilin B)
METKTFEIVMEDGGIMKGELYPEVAPITVENFVKLCNNHFYDGLIFHRVIKGFMIQGGGYTMKGGKLSEKEGAKEIKGEFKSNGWSKNTTKHTLGVISMARTTRPNSATSQFFLCSASTPKLDGEYAAFGKATDTESKKVIVEFSKYKTYAYSSSFTDMPENVIKIRTINLSNKKF